MRFDLTDLRLFVHVHDAGTITGGADASHMTLASASERIRGMEASLGGALLVRDPRGVRPTPAGLTLLHHARLVMQQVARLQGDLGDHVGDVGGHVRVLCNTSALAEHLPSTLGTFLTAHPGTSIDLEERPSDEVADALRREACDVGFASDAADLGDLEGFPFRADPLVLVVPVGHPLADRTSVALADVVDRAFVGLSDHSAFTDHIARQARRLGQRMNYRVRLRSFDAVCRLVGEGIGIGVVPQVVAARCARTAKVRRIALSDAWATRHLMLCVRSLDDLPPAARRLAQHVLASVPTASRRRD